MGLLKNRLKTNANKKVAGKVTTFEPKATVKVPVLSHRFGGFAMAA